MSVNLVNDGGERKRLNVHRLIAEVFIDNPNNLPQVDHKNNINTDNRIGNLRWVTSSENNNNKVSKY